MEAEYMFKAFFRATFVVLLLVLVGLSIWYFTLITLVVIVIAWLTWMFYNDPPEDWN